MVWLFAILGLVLVVVIGLVVLGRETARLAGSVRPAVFDLTEAVAFIADRLPEDAQGRLSHDDVRWLLLADADLLEEASTDAPTPAEVAHAAEDGAELPDEVIDEDGAVARLLALADESGRELEDRDVVAVLDGRTAYLEAIGAIGPRA